MNWIFDRPVMPRRRKASFSPRLVEALEERTLLADGITPAGGAPITVVAGTAISSAILASFVVSDPSGSPGTKWAAKIDFGDGQTDRNVQPSQVGSAFDFVDSHTYAQPGQYTVTVMIAVPGSQKPNDNTVTTQVTVTSPPTPGNLKQTPVHAKAREKSRFKVR